jgi:hypothetical protein
MATREVANPYTVSVLTREGALHPAWQNQQWSVYVARLSVLANDLAKIARSPEAFKGAHAFAIHEGVVTDSSTKPLMYVLEGGEIQRL